MDDPLLPVEVTKLTAKVDICPPEGRMMKLWQQQRPESWTKPLSPERSCSIVMGCVLLESSLQQANRME